MSEFTGGERVILKDRNNASWSCNSEFIGADGIAR